MTSEEQAEKVIREQVNKMGMGGYAVSAYSSIWKIAIADAICVAENDALEHAAQLVRDWALKYPEDIFIPPPHGQHGQTVDACSAAAIRAILPNVADAIDALKSPPPAGQAQEGG